MSSLRRIIASRANGALSRGPVSDSGKARSSQNATTHGLTAESVILSFEDPARFQSLLEDCLADLQPDSPSQTQIIEEYAATLWRIRRAQSIENAVLEHEFDAQEKSIREKYRNPNHGTRLAVAALRLHDHSRTLANIERQETRLQRRADLLFRRLLALKALRNSAAKNGNFPDEPNPISGHSPDEPGNKGE